MLLSVARPFLFRESWVVDSKCRLFYCAIGSVALDSVDALRRPCFCPRVRLAVRRRCAERGGAAKPAGNAKRSKGTKVLAAETPTKKRLGTDDSKFAESAG